VEPGRCFTDRTAGQPILLIVWLQTVVDSMLNTTVIAGKC
jgi:hypothetical protein